MLSLAVSLAVRLVKPSLLRYNTLQDANVNPHESRAAPDRGVLRKARAYSVGIMTRSILIVALVVAGIPGLIYLLWFVHRTLDRACMRHARIFCSRSGLDIRRVRCQPAFEQSGVKTESASEGWIIHSPPRRIFVSVVVGIFKSSQRYQLRPSRHQRTSTPCRIGRFVSSFRTAGSSSAWRRCSRADGRARSRRR